MRPLTRADLKHLLSPILYTEQWQRLGQGQEIAFAYSFEEGDAYRVEASSKGGELRMSAHRLRPD
jgi:hypothetical protein